MRNALSSEDDNRDESDFVSLYTPKLFGLFWQVLVEQLTASSSYPWY